MPSTVAAIEKILSAAAQLKQHSKANEANTRSHLIDPLLAALGWDIFDVTAVDREFVIPYDGTVLDYALLSDGKPRVFVEAKALGKSLVDPKFVSQTLNYANNMGVVWCVLTDGLRYRVFKANESVDMEQKLLFEVNLADGADGRASDVAHALERIGHEWVASGRLAEWAERIFTDVRVREALKGLIAEPPNGLFAAIEGELEAPVPSRSQIQTSLQSIILGAAGSAKPPQPSAPTGGTPVAGKGTGNEQPSGSSTSYDLTHHTQGKSANVADLFEKATSYARQRGGDVTEKIGKVSVNYFVGKRPFCSVKTFHSKVVVYLVTEDPAAVAAENPPVMRDMTGIGHNGNGNVEYSLSSHAQLDELATLVERSYAAAQ